MVSDIESYSLKAFISDAIIGVVGSLKIGIKSPLMLFKLIQGSIVHRSQQFDLLSFLSITFYLESPGFFCPGHQLIAKTKRFHLDFTFGSFHKNSLGSLFEAVVSYQVIMYGKAFEIIFGNRYGQCGLLIG